MISITSGHVTTLKAFRMLNTENVIQHMFYSDFSAVACEKSLTLAEQTSNYSNNITFPVGSAIFQLQAVINDFQGLLHFEHRKE